MSQIVSIGVVDLHSSFLIIAINQLICISVYNANYVIANLLSLVFGNKKL